MGRVLKAAFLSLLAWVMLAGVMLLQLAPASADTRHCSYQFHIGFVAASSGDPVPIEAPVGVVGSHFKVKGRFPGSCSWWEFYCLDPAPFARFNAAHGAERCAIDSVNSGGARPQSCIQKQDFGSGKWAQVVEWSVGDIKSHAFDATCRWAREQGRELSQITIWAVRERGWSSQCDIRGRRFFQVWQSTPNQNPCTRPVASDPTGGVGRPPGGGGSAPGGRPVPADPVPTIPPPPSHGIVAAPDLMVEKALEKTCLPNVPCKFKVTITNDGRGTFNGPLTVTDTIKPASERLTSSGPAPWACEGGNGSYTCKHPGVQLATGQSVELSLAFTNTQKGRGTVENCAQIEWEFPPLEGICNAAIEEALARERENMDEKTASETDKAVKEFQCRAGVETTGKPDAALLRMAFKSLGMGDTNAENDIACTASSIQLPEPETETITPENTRCTGGRRWNPSTRVCACPSDAPNWTGRECTRPHVYDTPQPCTGGRYRNSAGECQCPATVPYWDGKYCQARPPRTMAPRPRPGKPTVAPVCTGGRYWDFASKRCLCPSNRPAWNGKVCSTRTGQPAPMPGLTPGATNPLCAAGMYWDRNARACRCPKSAPYWSAKQRRCVTTLSTAPPKPLPPKPMPVRCTGGQFFDAAAKRCRCPSDKPIWTGTFCQPLAPGLTPGATNPLCSGGMYWDRKAKACRCPKSAPFWSAKSKRCVAKLNTVPPKPRPPKPRTTYPPKPSKPTVTTAPPVTAPSPSKLVCRGGKLVGALCWCGIGKFPKKVGNNVYQCQ